MEMYANGALVMPSSYAGMMISCLSFGGIIGLGLDALDGTLDSKYKW